MTSAAGWRLFDCAFLTLDKLEHMENDRNPMDEGVFYAPAPPDTRSYTALGNFTVDGETFTVRQRDDDGSAHYDWITGPNDGYGFSAFSLGSGSNEISYEQHVASIRDFLAGIDPATGYLPDP